MYHGPPRVTAGGGLISKGKETIASLAFRSGARRAVILKRSFTNGATAGHSPINFLSWGHVVHMCDLLRLPGESRRLALAKADHADARNQLSFSGVTELAAAATLRNLEGGVWYGSIPETELFGTVAAAHRFNCLSSAIAPLARRYLKIPRIGHYEDFGSVALRALVNLAPRPFARFNDELPFVLKENKSQADSTLEFSGLAISFRDDCEEVIARWSLSEDGAEKLVAFARVLWEAGASLSASSQKLAGRLRFAQNAVMGGFGRAALELIYELIAKWVRSFFENNEELVGAAEGSPPGVIPRLRVNSNQGNPRARLGFIPIREGKGV